MLSRWQLSQPTLDLGYSWLQFDPAFDPKNLETEPNR